MRTYFTLSDQCLVNLLRESDSEAFVTLYDRYWGKLYNVAYYRLQDVFEAEEVVQDIYTRLWKNKDKLTVDTDFNRYLCGAVKLEVINRLTKRARTFEREERVTQSMYIINDCDIHHRIDLQRLLIDVDETIETLPQKCRIVFNLSRKSYLPHKDIAAQLKISEKTVQKHITFALKALRKKHLTFL